MAPRKNWELRQAVFAVCGQHPKDAHPWTALSAPALADALAEVGIEKSERQCRRYIDEFAGLTEGERREYGLVHWPETFGSVLPWESSPAVVGLLGRFLRQGRRPHIRYARWYWHLTQARPDWPEQRREAGARLLSAADAGLLDDPDGARRRVEAALSGADETLSFEVVFDTPGLPLAEVSDFVEGTIATGAPPALVAEIEEDPERLARSTPDAARRRIEARHGQA
ncbi:MAG: hypothetical protein KC495_13715 [Dehalococcoidia bacterium]|nr:hypothetical protein [Dehalococcoidia bacterium]